MDLDGAWEIGLAEIQYPHSWYNVKNNESWLNVHFYKESELQKPLVLLPDGYYSSTKRIINAIEGEQTARNSRINSTWVSEKSIIKSI
jgi:hypothetical protein